MAGVPVVVEVIMLVARGGELAYRAVRRPLAVDDEPDSVARAAWDLPPDTTDGLLHSTSWRHESGRVILTYVALPDPDPSARHAAVAGWVARGENGMEPSPDVELAEVAAHAARHLSFLEHTDDEVAKALAPHPAIRRLLTRYAPAMAGQVADSDEPDGL